MISSTSAACCWLNCATTYLNFVRWRVMAANSNWASAYANQTAGRSGQKVGKRRATVHRYAESLDGFLCHAVKCTRVFRWSSQVTCVDILKDCLKVEPSITTTIIVVHITV